MNTQTEWDFAIVAASGLTQQEFAKLAKVTRVTANLWLNGHRHPSHYIAPRVVEILKRLADAVEEGTLPPPTRPGNGTDRDRRAREILHAIRR